MKLVELLSARYGLSKKKAKALLDRRIVFVNDRRTWIASYEVRPGDRVEVADSPSAGQAPAVLFEDGSLLIVDKPAGILSAGPASLETVLRRTTGNKALSACHRLDRDTSGAMALAKTPEALERMEDLFKARKIVKTYLALVSGKVPFSEKTADAPIDGLKSVSHFRTLQALPPASLLEVRIETGRTHQIRKHLQALGLHLVGEKEYSVAAVRKPEFKRAGRQMLHQRALSFRHPFTGSDISVRADLPADFVKICRLVGLDPDPSPQAREKRSPR
jgi:RluA family pseudouridine synthase